jgi:ABC-2 type transport system permease protein
LPLLAIGVIEKIAFNTSHFAAMLQYRLSGGPKGVPFTAGNMPVDSMDPLMHLNPGQFLINPGLWIGLAVAAAFLAAAVRIRRYRGPN